jgi:hypothetical protein
MAQLSESDRQEIQNAAAQALVADDSMAADAVAGVDLGDIKDFLCKNWPMIKKVLQFLAETVGGVPGRVAKALIAAGDLLYRRVCDGNG